MPANISGSNPGVSPLPTPNTSLPPLVERNENARVDTEHQERNNDFTSYLNEQSISHEKRVEKAKTFDAADAITQQSVYSPSNGSTAI